MLSVIGHMALSDAKWLAGQSGGSSGIRLNVFIGIFMTLQNTHMNHTLYSLHIPPSEHRLAKIPYLKYTSFSYENKSFLTCICF